MNVKKVVVQLLKEYRKIQCESRGIPKINTHWSVDVAERWAREPKLKRVKKPIEPRIKVAKEFEI